MFGSVLSTSLGVSNLSMALITVLLTSSQGHHRRPPAFLSSATWCQALGVIDLGDFGDLKCLALVLGGS